jgi:hypothetical protein
VSEDPGRKPAGSTRGRGVVRQWTKTCSDYDDEGNATEVLYQTVFEGKVFEVRATSEEVVFSQSPRRQVRADVAEVLEAIRSGSTIEEALDEHLLGVDKPESVARFGALASRFEERPARLAREGGRDEIGSTESE